MKSLRKSLNGNKDSIRTQISTPLPLPPVSKPASAILPPQKVIRALAAYRPAAPQELPFKKGDFFYVLRDVDAQGAYYEAHNPVTGARGLVPRSMFEEFGKTAGPIRTSQFGAQGPPPPTIPSPTTSSAQKTQVFYAIVLHDFVAERADELDAKRGDAITVVAQSNREWFVAKPIGRLGRPGLIPVSFVEIHDPATGKPIPDVEALMDRGDLPKVEDWKRAMFSYKQNSIALGVIDSPVRDSFPTSPLSYNNAQPHQEHNIAVQGPSPQASSHPSHQSPPPPPITPNQLAEGILISAKVVSFHFEMDAYWFRIDAVFQPYRKPGQPTLPPAKQLILFRVYDDFYDFQVSLLDTFPREAGRQPPQERILPYMPGPSEKVDDALTAIRRKELDDYVRSLCDLSNLGAKYILEHLVVREFLVPKPGDVENEIEPRTREIELLTAKTGAGRRSEYDDRAAPRNGDASTEVRDSLSRLRVNDDDGRSDGSEYEDEGYAASPQRHGHDRDRDRHPYSRAEHQRQDSGSRLHAHSQSHQRTGSSSSLQRSPSPYSSGRLSNSSYNGRESPRPPRTSDYNNQQSRWNDGHHGSNPSHSYSNNNPNITPPLSTGSRSSQGAATGRARSHSSANNPPISTTNPQTAFVKIKIFDRVADDVIAIRVHPRVTHSELLEKVQARLGGEVVNLRYRDSISNGFVGIDSDPQLSSWMEGTDKHVLYAD